jgi:hypothetical protein
MIYGRLDNDLKTKLYAMVEIECGKHSWTEGTRTHVQEQIVSVLVEKRPDIHVTQMRELVRR